MFLKGQVGCQTFSCAYYQSIKVIGTNLPMVGAVQIVGHGWILCCQGVNLRWDRIVILRSVYSLDTSSYRAHLFDPGFDAMIQPQLSGFPLAGAQNLTDLTIGEAILFGLQQQLFWYRITVE